MNVPDLQTLQIDQQAWHHTARFEILQIARRVTWARLDGKFGVDYQGCTLLGALSKGLFLKISAQN